MTRCNEFALAYLLITQYLWKSQGGKCNIINAIYCLDVASEWYNYFILPFLKHCRSFWSGQKIPMRTFAQVVAPSPLQNDYLLKSCKSIYPPPPLPPNPHRYDPNRKENVVHRSQWKHICRPKPKGLRGFSFPFPRVPNAWLDNSARSQKIPVAEAEDLNCSEVVFSSLWSRLRVQDEK